MHPYDAEKVRIANDLYSALLKSKGNDTIIQMIYEKGRTNWELFKGAKGLSRVEPVDSSDHTDRTGEMLLWLRFSLNSPMVCVNSVSLCRELIGFQAGLFLID